MSDNNNDNKDIIVRCNKCYFIDFLDKMENYDIDFVDLSGFKNYIFMAPLNKYKYMIHSISNNNETYYLQYSKKHNIKETNLDINSEKNENNIVLANIPYGIFNPTTLYDLEINITKKTLNLINEYVIIDIIDSIVKIQNNKKNKEKEEKEEDKEKRKKKRFFNIFDC